MFGMQVCVKFCNSPTASSFHSHATNTPPTTKLKNVLSCFVKHFFYSFLNQHQSTSSLAQ